MRQPESPHRKTPTPIVAKQKTNDMENTIHKLAESTFLPLFTNLCKKQKGIKPLIKIRRFPLIIIRFLFGITIISHFLRFVNMFIEIYQFTFRAVEKSSLV